MSEQRLLWDLADALCRGAGSGVCFNYDPAADGGCSRCGQDAAALLPVVLADREKAVQQARAEAWDEGHAAGRDYQADGWNSDAHDPREGNPYREAQP